METLKIDGLGKAYKEFIVNKGKIRDVTKILSLKLLKETHDEITTMSNWPLDYAAISVFLLGSLIPALNSIIQTIIQIVG